MARGSGKCCLKTNATIKRILEAMNYNLYTIIASLVFCYFAWRFNRGREDRAKDLIAHICTALNLNQENKSSLRGQINGSLFRVETLINESLPIVVKIHFDCAYPRRLTVHRENFIDRFAKLIGLARGLCTGHPSFDREFYIDSDDPTFVKKLFSDLNVRHQVCQIFSYGISSLDFLDERGILTLTCKLSTVRSLTLHDTRKLMAAAAELARLEPPQTQKPDVINKPRLKKIVAWIALGLFVPFFVFSPLMLLWNEQHPLLIEPGLWARAAWIGPPILLPSILAGFLFLRGRSDAHKILFLPWGMIILLIFFPVSSLFLFNLVNVAVDSSKARRATYLVTSTDYFSPRRSPTEYFLILKNVNPESRWPESVKLRIPPEIYDEAQTAKTARLRIKDGALGYPWVEKIRLLDR